MPGFQYFIPKISSAIPSVIEDLKLDVAFGRNAGGKLNTPAYVPIRDDQSPSKAPGLLIGDPRGPDQPEYNAETQAWFPVGDPPKYYIGHDKGNPPTADDLVRDVICTGQPLRLGDGEFWIIPTARLLPRKRILGKTGQQESVVIDSHAYLMEMAIEVAAAYDKLAAHCHELNAEGVQSEFADNLAKDLGIMTAERELEIISLTLSANYRINLDGALVLGLFDDTCEQEILRVLIDWDSAMELQANEIRQAQKKKPE